MRRMLFFSMLFILILSAQLSGEEQSGTEKFPKRFSFSWSASFAGHPEAFSRTSVLSLGFILFHSERLDIRNQLEFCNGVIVMEKKGVSNYKKVIAEKISIGKMCKAELFRPYGFFEGRVGTSGEELYDFQKNPLVWNLGLGTGLDIFTSERLSYFIELGFLGNFYQGEFLPQQRFELGVMYHF